MVRLSLPGCRCRNGKGKTMCDCIDNYEKNVRESGLEEFEITSFLYKRSDFSRAMCGYGTAKQGSRRKKLTIEFEFCPLCGVRYESEEAQQK